MPATIGMLFPAGVNPLRNRHRLCFIVPLLGIWTAAMLLADPRCQADRPTGSPQQPGCLKCHSQHGLNDGRMQGGIFQIDGVPRRYAPGKSYLLKVTIGQPGQSCWGFRFSARSSGSGQQAGSLIPTNRFTRVGTDSGDQFIAYSQEGKRKGQKDGPIEFEFTWLAPVEADGLVIFNATGNAADGDDSTSGDFIYTAGHFSAPFADAPTTAAPANAAGRQEPVEVPVTAAKKMLRMQDTSKVLNLPAPVDLKKGSLEINIQHRFFQSLTDSGFGDAFGIDAGANINVGFDYALTDRLSAGMARARSYQVVALAGAYELRTNKESRWKTSIHGGVEGQNNFHKYRSPYLQWANTLDFGQVRLNIVPTAILNCRPDDRVRLAPEVYVNPKSNHTLALGLGADIALHPRFSLAAEYVPRLAGFGGLAGGHSQVGGGMAIRTLGHVFTILVSTSRDFTPGLYGVNAQEQDVSLGFNIYRRIR